MSFETSERRETSRRTEETREEEQEDQSREQHDIRKVRGLLASTPTKILTRIEKRTEFKRRGKKKKYDFRGHESFCVQK
jgi:hypothetical protein